MKRGSVSCLRDPVPPEPQRRARPSRSRTPVNTETLPLKTEQSAAARLLRLCVLMLNACSPSGEVPAGFRCSALSMTRSIRQLIFLPQHFSDLAASSPTSYYFDLNPVPATLSGTTRPAPLKSEPVPSSQPSISLSEPHVSTRPTPDLGTTQNHRQTRV